ncbi:MAG TPA: sigma-70 family RNA polymerase sigma factor [Pseudomonadales bacterium]|nr:sigma-70 family RNA polymerase sigma factor [Pseudomonadales bacterium]
MITQETVITTTEYIPDAELVSRTLAGDRDAFNRIVSRYQILICSLAYSRIGHLGQSEDVAQETFITAWKRLRLLRQPEKLRAWLCGIVHNRAKKCLQHEIRNPVHSAELLETVEEAPALVALPSDETISHEEEALLWRALEKIPQLYREPLILFYREHQSIENVAAEMELSEDAVKQRLSRGRKMLHDEVESFVEKTLRKTTPTPAFSSAVLAALPAVGGPAATAGAGVAGKSGLAAKGFFAAFLLPFVGIFTGFAAQWIMFGGHTGRPARLRLVITWAIVLTFAIGGQALVQFLGHHYAWSQSVFFAAMAGFWWFYAISLATWITPMYWHSRAQAAANATTHPELKPMTTLNYAFVVAGTHIMMFWGIINLAWQSQDRSGALIIAGLMTALGIWNFSKFRGLTGKAMGPAYIFQIASCGGVMLAAFNLRFDQWAANGYGMTIAELHQRLPLWMVPSLTAVLVIWTIILAVMTKPKAPNAQPLHA